MSEKYFNKGVKALDAPDIGHVARETPDIALTANLLKLRGYSRCCCFT